LTVSRSASVDDIAAPSTSSASSRYWGSDSSNGAMAASTSLARRAMVRPATRPKSSSSTFAARELRVTMADDDNLELFDDRSYYRRRGWVRVVPARRPRPMVAARRGGAGPWPDPAFAG